MRYVFAAAIFCLSLVAALQPPINAALARRTGPLTAATVSFLVGTAALLLFTLLASQATFGSLREAPAWELTGGLLGALFVYGSIIFVPRLGATGLMAAVVAGQLAGGVLVDRLGLFGLPKLGITPLRVLGLLFLLVGALLAVRR